MSSHSASSYIAVPIDTAGDAEQARTAALAETRKIAAERTGGEDGLKLVGEGLVEQDGVTKLATTWVREWSDPEPTAEVGMESA